MWWSNLYLRFFLVVVVVITFSIQTLCATSMTPFSFLYNGEYQDTTAHLLYLRARRYQTVTQRFLTEDSYNVWNKYAFDRADPINRIDPNGHLSKGAWIGIGFAAGLLVGFAFGYGVASRGFRVVMNNVSGRLEALAEQVQGLGQGAQEAIADVNDRVGANGEAIAAVNNRVGANGDAIAAVNDRVGANGEAIAANVENPNTNNQLNLIVNRIVGYLPQPQEQVGELQAIYTRLFNSWSQDRHEINVLLRLVEKIGYSQELTSVQEEEKEATALAENRRRGRPRMLQNAISRRARSASTALLSGIQAVNSGMEFLGNFG